MLCKYVTLLLYMFILLLHTKIKIFTNMALKQLGKNGYQYASVWNVWKGKQTGLHEVLLETPSGLSSGGTDFSPLTGTSSVSLSTTRTSGVEVGAEGLDGAQPSRPLQHVESFASHMFIGPYIILIVE